MPRSSLFGLNSVLFDLSHIWRLLCTHCLSAYMLMGCRGILQVSGRNNKTSLLLFGVHLISCHHVTKQVPFCYLKEGCCSVFVILVQRERFRWLKQRQRKCKNDAKCVQLLCSTSEALPKNPCLFWVN